MPRGDSIMVNSSAQAYQDALNYVLPISEIFESIQGEGVRTGAQHTFIRIAGCSMPQPCKWCDTKFAFKEDAGRQLTLREIVSLVHLRDVVITGGEPLVHPRVRELCMILKDLNEADITIETNGTIYRDAIRNYVDFFSISPKLSSSGNTFDPRVIQTYLERCSYWFKVQIKFVIDTRTDADEKEVDSFLSAFQSLLELSGAYVVFQPMDDIEKKFALDEYVEVYRDLIEVGSSATAKYPKVRIQCLPQMHKILWERKPHC